MFFKLSTLSIGRNQLLYDFLTFLFKDKATSINIFKQFKAI